MPKSRGSDESIRGTGGVRLPQNVEGLAKVTQRNLIMHVYPRACHPHWRRSVAHLVARFDQFTGRRIVSVAYDTGTDTPDMVKDAFGACEIEIVAVRNSRLQEVESFPRLLEEVSREPGITFYCHSKGCTHCSPFSASHIWCDAMAEVCLDYPQLIDCALTESDICGAFRSTMQIMGANSPPWHFAGTWYWFRNDALFTRDWRNVDPLLWGAESYPGRIFPMERGRCLFFDHAETTHLYDPAFWDKAITPGLANWRRAMKGGGLAPIVEPGFSPSIRCLPDRPHSSPPSPSSHAQRPARA